MQRGQGACMRVHGKDPKPGPSTCIRSGAPMASFGLLKFTALQTSSRRKDLPEPTCDIPSSHMLTAWRGDCRNYLDAEGEGRGMR